MKALPREEIETSLQNKGFQRDEERDHIFYYFFYKGKKTKVRTKISRGSKYKDYGTDLLKMMKRDLYLDRLNELGDLLVCPMDESQYISILLNKGIISS